MEIITGLLLGLSTLLFMGAVFFYLIKTTIVSGKNAGAAVATGIILGDIIYVILLLQGFSEILKNESLIKWFALIGGILLLTIGISYLLKKKHISEDKNVATVSLWIHFTKGFVLNFINPFVAAVWIAFLAINESQFVDQSAVVSSLTITLLIIYITDLLKVFFAEKLRRFLTPSILKKAYRFMGIIMVLFGLKLCYHFFTLF